MTELYWKSEYEIMREYAGKLEVETLNKNHELEQLQQQADAMVEALSNIESRALCDEGFDSMDVLKHSREAIKSYKEFKGEKK